MAEQSSDPLAEATWSTAGWVVIDSATVVLGDLDAFVAWRTSGARMPGPYVFGERLVFFESLDDLDCPVEMGIIDGDPVALRVELYSDVADTAGGWEPEGEIVLDRPRCIVIDPMATRIDLGAQLAAMGTGGDTDLRADTGVVIGCVLDVPAGHYHVEVFRSDEHDEMGIRLRRTGTPSDGTATA